MVAAIMPRMATTIVFSAPTMIALPYVEVEEYSIKRWLISKEAVSKMKPYPDANPAVFRFWIVLDIINATKIAIPTIKAN